MSSDQPVRLLLAVDSDVWGGAEACVGHLLTELPERFACTLLATTPVPERLAELARSRGALVLVPQVRGKTNVRDLLEVSRAMAQVRPDLVHVNQSAPTNNRHVLGLALARRLPTVVALHLWSPLQGGLQDVLLRRAYRRAAQVLTVSAELEAKLVDQLGVEPSRLRVVHNGVAPLPRAAGSGLPGTVRLGALGRLVHHKGFDVLVEAVRALLATGRQVELVVAGDGPERDALQRQAAGLPVRLVGPVSDGAAFLRDLDAFVLPSRAEGLPLALLEAMTAGLPAVVTDVGDVAAAVRGTAIVVPPDDVAALTAGLSALLDDPSRRAILGAAARELALREHTAVAMASATAGAYDDALALHAGRRGTQR